MSELWNYGQHELNKAALLGYLQSNADSYMSYNDYDDEQKIQFGKALEYISKGINEDTISGTGYGTFNDSTGNLAEDDTTKQALRYVHTVANAYGVKSAKKKTTPVAEQTPQKSTFDYAKHGVLANLIKSINPTASTDADYNIAFDDYIKSFNGDNNALISDLSSRFDKHIESLENYQMDNKDEHIANIRTLQQGLKDGTIDATDIRNFSQVGQRDLGVALQNAMKPIPPKTPEGFVETQNPDGTKDIVPQNEQVAQQVKSEFGDMPLGEYLANFKNLGLEESDGYRLTGLFLDIGSIINPEPFSAAGMGYASDYLNYKADELDGINDSWWDDALNVGLSTLGAIPLIGDLGLTGKIAKNIIKTGKSLTKLAAIPGIFYGVANSEELKQSISNIVNNDFTVNDLRNAWTVVQLALGTTNAMKSAKAKGQAQVLDAKAHDALVVTVNNKGKKQDLQFIGQDKTDLEALKNDPIAFEKYIKENFEGLDDVKLVNINTVKGDLDWKNREHWYSLPKRKESTQQVNTSIKKVQDEGVVPQGFSRVKGFMKNTESATPTTRKSKPEESETPDGKTQETTDNKNQETKQEETVESTENKINIPSGRFDDSELVKTAETEVTTEVPKKSSESSKTEEKSKEKPKESVKATDIKPNINTDIVSKPARTKSKVSKESLQGFAQRFQRSKMTGEQKAMARMNLDDLDKMIKNNPNANQDAQKVFQGFKRGSASYTQALNDLINTGMSAEQAKKVLLAAKAFKEGGVLKAQNGTSIPEWFNYSQKALNGWNRELRNDKWTTQGVGFHTDADSLSSVYDANSNYTSDTQAIRDDIQNYYNQGKYKTTTDLINAYNTDANSINNFWKSDRTYNENTGNHAPIFKKLFASRSAGKDGNLSYNLGYQDDLESVMGSTMWHRRMDWYEKPFEALSDSEKKQRMHAITLGDGTTGYVYKQNDGTLGEVSPEEAQRLLSVTNPEEAVDTNPENVAETTAEKPGNSVTMAGETKPKIDEQPMPEKPSEPFFTSDKALAMINYYRTLQHNKKQLEYADRMVPLMYDPVEHHRSVYGNLRALAEGRRQAAELTSKAANPVTSDGNLHTAAQFEAYDKARQFILQGWQSDDETMRKMSELAWQQEKENRENRYNIAMKNRENMHQVNAEKLQARVNKHRADYESGTNAINEWRTWIAAKQKADSEKANLLFSRRLSNYINSNPGKYISGWGQYHQDIWDKSNSGQLLTNDEQKVLSQINSRLADAYYNEMYGKGEYYGTSINKPLWQPILQSGGKITKDMVKAIVSYLKESNKNYNKDIDRSARGLYNHIKLQRRK